MRELAQRIQLLDEQLARTKVRLRRITSAVAPELVGRKGVGPDTASTILVSVGDNPHRLGNERAFASLAGREPDTSQQRQDNTSSAQSRRRPPTQLGALAHRDRPARLPTPHRAYLERRDSEGRTKIKAIRCIKRYIAREVFAALAQTAAG
jgi:hypothetical protein